MAIGVPDTRWSRAARRGLSAPASYLAALVIAALAVALRYYAGLWLGSHPALTLLLLPVLLCAFLGGLGPGVLATAIIAIGTAYLVLQRPGSIVIQGPADLLAWVGFVLVGVAISMLADALRQKRGNAQREVAKAPIEWKIHLVFVVALVVLFVTGGLSYYSIEQLHGNLAALQRAEQTIDAMKALMSGVRDVETSVGRFVMSGKDDHLASYRSGRQTIDAELASVRRQTADTRSQAERFTTLSHLVVQRVAVAENIIALRRSDFAAARDGVIVGDGQRLTTAIGNLLREMEDVEDVVVDNLNTRSESYSRLTRVTILLGGTLTLMFVLGAMLVIHRDFSGRRRADAALREAHELLEARVAERTDELARSHDALAEREEQIRSIVSAAMDAIVVVNDKRCVVMCNEAAQRIFDRAESDVTGRPFGELMPAWADAIPDPPRHGSAATVAADLRGVRNGVEFPVEASVSHFVHRGSPFTTVILRDVTERRRVESQHRRIERIEALGTLAGGIAHDFNNILPAIRGFTAIAASELEPEHPVQDKLMKIEAAARRASDLVRRILAFGRPQQPAAMSTDPAATVEEALHLVRATLPRLIEIRTRIDHGLPAIDIDATDVCQVVINLMGNAADAIGSSAVGAIDVTLERADIVSAAEQAGVAPGRYVRLVVKDTGGGMDAATQARIFDPFFTTKPVGKGTGLGLSIVHGIVKSANGAIVMDSEPGKGTRFDLYFPIGTPSAATPPGPCAVVRGTGQRLLYVDDEEDLAYLVTYVLKSLGYEVVAITSAADAVREFRARPNDFDAVITDLSMPGMSGFDLAREVVAIRPDVFVVIASGYVVAEDEARAREAGAREIIRKPQTVEEYAAALDQLFRATVPA